MKNVIALAAVGEGATGLAFLVVPSLIGRLLFGEGLGGVAIPLARVIGIALIALAVSCWPDGNMRRPIFGMLTYSVLVMLYLIYAGSSGGMGILLWPAVAVHAVLTTLLVLTWSQAHNWDGNRSSKGNSL